MNTSMDAAIARDKERNYFAELDEAVEKINNACLGDLALTSTPSVCISAPSITASSGASTSTWKPPALTTT